MSTPVNGATNVSLSPTLSWGVSSGATSYEYCLDTTAGSTCNTAWVSTGTNRTVTLSNLPRNTTHYWLVRSVYAGAYTYANNSTWRSFRTVP